MTSYTQLQPLQTASELPVEQLHNRAVEAFKATHKELASLPGAPGEKPVAVEHHLRAMGVECDNDMSMLVTGAMGDVLGSALGHAFGLAAHSPLQAGLDMVSSMYGERAEEKQANASAERTSFKRDNAAKTTSVFAGKYAKAAPVVPATRKQPAAKIGATSMLRAGTQNARMPANAAQRRHHALAQMKRQRDDIMTLKDLKTSGPKFMRRATVEDAGGNLKSAMLDQANAPVNIANARTRTAANQQRTLRPASVTRPAGMGMSFG